jgi:hypothetical protein
MKTFRFFSFIWIFKTVLCGEDVNILDYINKEQNFYVNDTAPNLLKNEKWRQFTEKFENVCNILTSDNYKEILEVTSELQEITYKSFTCLDYHILISSLKESIQLMNRFLILLKQKDEENKLNLFLKEFDDIKNLLPEIEKLFSKFKIREEVNDLSFILKAIRRDLFKDKNEYCNVKKASSLYEIMNEDGSFTEKFKSLGENEFLNESGSIRKDVYVSISEFNFYLKREWYFINLLIGKLDDICGWRGSIEESHEF